MNEIDILRRLSHEGVLEAEAVFESINSVYVVCEYLQGRQLLDKMQVLSFPNLVP
jgi:serine/threonine protein kinase